MKRAIRAIRLMPLIFVPAVALAAGNSDGRANDGTAPNEKNLPTAAATMNGTAIDVKITGMTCGSCVQSVREALSKLNGVDVKTLKVELKGNHATLVVANNDAKMVAAIQEAVKKAGYKVAKIDIVATP